MNRAKWELFLIVLGAVIYLFSYPHGIHGDASVRYDALLSFLSTGKLAPMVYSYVHPLVSAPLLLFGYLYKDGFWWVSRFNAFAALGTIAYAAWCARRWKGWSAGSVRLLVLLLLAGTMLPKHVTDYYAEVFSACMVLVAIFFFQKNKSAWAILALCLSVWNMIATIFGAGALLVFFAIRSRRWRYVLASPLLVIGFAVENYLKFSEFYPTAYMAMQAGPHTMLPYAMGPGFSYPLFFGLLNVFLSFGRGILFFAPGLLAFLHPALWRGEDKSKQLLWAGFVYLLGITLVYAKFWAWHGGAFWGPRYFLVASLLAAFALTELWRERDLSLVWRVYWVGAVMLSLWVGCQGVLYGTDFLGDCYSQAHELEFVCHYVPQYSALWRVFIIGPHLEGRRITYLIYALLIGGTFLWGPLRELAHEAATKAREWWRNYGPTTGWKV